jgi:hypothetical protein
VGPLRSEMTPDQMQDQLEASSESLPEAVTVHRDVPAGAATATTHSAGDEPYSDMADEAGSRLPADPPTGSAEG